jgi:hypothetical protein
MKIIGCVLPPLTLHMSQVIVDVFFLVVSVCVLNQVHGHWLLYDVLNVIITMSLKLKEKSRISLNLQDLIDDDSIVTHELSLLASNIRREICGILDGFLSFFKKYERNKRNNMLSLMLDPRFKSMKLVSFLINRKQLFPLWKSMTKDLYFLCF